MFLSLSLSHCFHMWCCGTKGPHGTAMVDFDRSRLGPYGWDVVRLLISMSIAAKQQTSYVLPSATLWAMLESYMWGFRNPNLPVRPMDKLLVFVSNVSPPRFLGPAVFSSVVPVASRCLLALSLLLMLSCSAVYRYSTR